MCRNKFHDAPKATSQAETWLLHKYREAAVFNESEMTFTAFWLVISKKKKHRIKNDINNTFAVCQVWAFQFPCWVYLLAGMAQSDV